MGGEVRKHRSDKVIMLITFVLMMIGLVVIYAVGPSRANYLNAAYGYEYVGPQEYFIHQLISVIVATVAFVVAFKFPYNKIQKWAKWLLLAGIVLSVLLFILALVGSAMANCSNGACRWISLGPLSLQPAEVMKLGLVLYLAGLISERKEEGELEKAEFWLPFLIVAAVSLFLVVVLQKDLGSGVSMLAIIAAMLFASGVSWYKFVIFMVAVGVAGVASILISPHRMERIMTYMGGEEVSDDDSYHIENAMMAIGSGGLFGVGVGNSVEATGYLPESINDSVFAVMGETFGFVGLLAVLLCFLILAMRLLHTATYAEEEQHGLVAVGMFAWIISHVVVNVAAMTGLIPLTGITLPLLSYGGTSMMFIAAGLGICLQISCYTRIREVRDEGTGSRRGLRGAYHSSRRGA